MSLNYIVKGDKLNFTISVLNSDAVPSLQI